MTDFEIGSMGNFGDADVTFSPARTKDSLSSRTIFEEDPADKLPKLAAKKFVSIREEAESARATYLPRYERVKELREALERLSGRINELQYRNGFKPDSELIRAERETETKLREKLKEATEEYESRREIAYPSMRLAERIERYVKSVRDPSKFVVGKELTPPKVAKPGDLIGVVDKIRKRIEALRIEREVTKSAPIHSSRAKSIARAFVYGIAADGAPDCAPCVESAMAPILPKNYRGQGFNQPEAPIDHLGLLFWACRDQIVAAFEREIEDVSDDASALSDEQRADRLAGIERELFDLEQQEETAIALGRLHYVNIPRRDDIDPRVALGLDISAPAPRNDEWA